MNPVAGVGGDSSDVGCDDVADQVVSSGLQQIQVRDFSDVVLGEASVANAPTIATTSSAITTSAITTSAATSTSATTSVGKGSSGGRSSNKGKGPAPRRGCTAGVVVSAASVSAPTGIATTATGGASALELVDLTSSQTVECCGFHVCTPDLLALRGMENDLLCAFEKVAFSIFRSLVGGSRLFRGAAGVDISNLRDESVASVAAHMSNFVGVYFANIYSRIVASFHFISGESVRFSDEEADKFRRLFFAGTVARIKECLAIKWNSEISRTLEGVPVVPATSDTVAEVKECLAIKWNLGISRTLEGAPVVPATSSCFRAPAATATPAVVAPAVVAPASPSTTHFVDLFGFKVLPEFAEMVDTLISEVCAFARRTYPYVVRVPVSDVMCKLSVSERLAWCVDNVMLYETSLVSRCVAVYYAKLLLKSIEPLCAVRAWDSSSRSLSPLMGSMLRDFWLSLDQAILRAVGNFFISRWNGLIGNFFVPLPLGPLEGSSALCGGDFISAYSKISVPSSAVSGCTSVAGEIGAQAVPHDDIYVAGGDLIDLFGFEVPVEVGEIVNVLIREVSALARRTYPSMVGAPVLDALLELLAPSEQFAWLTSNMMLYKTSFMAKCFSEYCSEFRPGLIDSLFSVRDCNTSGRSLLSLTGDSLRIFWISLSSAIVDAVGDIFLAEWGESARLFFVPGPGEEPPFTVLCGRDFVNANSKVGVPELAISRSGSITKVRRAQGVSCVAEPAGGVSLAGSGSVISSSVTTSAGVVEPDVAGGVSGRVDYSLGLKKSFMIREGIGESSSSVVPSSSVVSSSSLFSTSSVAAGSLSSASVGMGSVSSAATTTTFTYSGNEDIGVRLAALLNQGLPPSPPPASESIPTEGGVSSSSRVSVRGKRKRKKKR
ncbi:hypothetical protein [Candidatus Ichthyocystis sparus]|uniref:hypothetical protein n=1 Tax=Candidatus Ichthyocystis sparus TaxID=1561004 RepID=UPI000AE29CBD|nr:hypothetical protein [Candidatus Ichthyocystis sparus]